MGSDSESTSIYAARFSPAKLERGTTRAQKFATASRQNADVRREIETWIEQSGLAAHISLLPEGRVFNTLFLEADEEGESKLGEVPGILDYAPCDDIEVTLLAGESHPAGGG